MKVAELIRERIDDRRAALGNSKRGLKELASDYLNSDVKSRAKLESVARGCFLTVKTVERVMECDPDYRPQNDTLERVLRYYSVTIVAENRGTIKREFRNRPKR